MRGPFRAVRVAASTLVLAIASAHAAAPAKPAAAVNLVSPRSASEFLAGSSFNVSGNGPFGTIAESGTFLTSPVTPSLLGPPGPRPYDVRDLAARISLSSDLSLDLGYQLDDASRLGMIDSSASAFDGLFLSGDALSLSTTPYDSSTYVGASLKLSDDVKIHLGDAVATQDRNAVNTNTFASLGRPVTALIDLGTRTANSIFAGVSLNTGDSEGIDLTASRTTGREKLFDAPVPSLQTSAVDVSANLKFDGGWVTTASYGEGLEKLDVKPSAVSLSSVGELHRTGYALAVAKHGVFGDDALGLSVSRQADPDGGYATFGGHLSQPAFIGADHLLTTDEKQETDIEVGYVTNFLDGAVALQTNAAYDMNFQGQNGTNAVELLSRAKIKF